jgi:phage-related protein
MVVFGRRFHWSFLTLSASLLSANFIGPVTTASAQQSQQPGVQDPRTPAETAGFDAFLDAHPEIDAQLRTNPSLINDQKWLQDHREVLAYFDHHPQEKNEIAGSPSYFIRREGRRASREARERIANLRREQTADFKQFLNSNPQISKQLNADPVLIKDPRYLDEHPGLQAFLYDHPLVNKDLREEPSLFLQRDTRQNNLAKKGTDDHRVQGLEKQTDRRASAYVDTRAQVAHDQQQVIDSTHVRSQAEQHEEPPSRPQSSPASAEIVSFDVGREVRTPHDALEARRTPASNTNQIDGDLSSQERIASNSVLTASEIVSFDQFLGEHKKINKDLERNPERIKDSNYLRKHEDLQDYLNQHTGLREELTQRPAYFMNRRNRYELSVAERTVDRRSPDSAKSASSMVRLSQYDLRTTDRFLEKHKNINKDLEKNPPLAADPHYLNKHKDFREFLERNPDINAAMRKDPVQFMQNQRDRFERMHQKM